MRDLCRGVAGAGSLQLYNHLTTVDFSSARAAALDSVSSGRWREYCAPLGERSANT
jgi:hypothetical protein